MEKLKNDNSMWANGISRQEMEKNLIQHILQLSRELSQGVYTPDPIRMFPVLKGDGKKRIISALTLRDKLAQRAVLSVLTPIAETLFHHDSFGYRPKRSIDMVMSRIREHIRCDYYWIVNADIKSFFDNIPHKKLQTRLKKAIPDKKLLQLIIKRCNSNMVPLSKREIAIFADQEYNDLKNMLVDSKLFRHKNIERITHNSIKRAEDFSLLLVHWKAFQDEMDSILSIKKDGAALIVYAPQKEGFIEKSIMDKINQERNTIVVNFRGRLLNDILVTMITTGANRG